VKLAVVDWGIGGLSFWCRFAAAHPHVPVVYFSDSGFTPYGKVPRRTLARRVDRVLAHLASAQAPTTRCSRATPPAPCWASSPRRAAGCPLPA
jgi:glutamate racemase